MGDLVKNGVALLSLLVGLAVVAQEPEPVVNPERQLVLDAVVKSGVNHPTLFNHRFVEAVCSDAETSDTAKIVLLRGYFAFAATTPWTGRNAARMTPETALSLPPGMLKALVQAGCETDAEVKRREAEAFEAAAAERAAEQEKLRLAAEAVIPVIDGGGE